MTGAATQEEKARRDAALERLTLTSPYHRFIGVSFVRMGDELTARLAYSEHLIGNPLIPALHGGVTGALLEITAIMQLAWDELWRGMEAGGAEAAAIHAGRLPKLPKTIDLTIDYLRSGRPRDAYARATVQKAGRRVANVRVEAWQDSRDRPIAAAHGHFLMQNAG
ncbi:PaaI family thioesterase [Pikeienuella piscinae]|uniref:PaaI family thioesterase n=1 Tax=Pikeienuella piscinae TaxID=2748098 RepID=A0A7L5BZF5_9RHOB|nr:PaaI family thioesterase [Pikeienuella piscinae]QIE56218.1 PaaI family thioesterase [Pikeienuella piscinae]